VAFLSTHEGNCTGCGMLRAGVCINCAEKIAALILESGPGELATEPCSGACREAIELYFSTPWRTLFLYRAISGRHHDQLCAREPCLGLVRHLWRTKELRARQSSS
jgi:hypothetical protein